MQNSEQSAFRRDFVVLDCQPPSKIVMVVSSTMAILLPWRYTNETPSMVTTSVLPDFQFLFAWIARHICCSILRMRVVGCLTCVYNTWDEAGHNRCCATLSIVQHHAVEVGLVCLSKKCLMSIQHKVDHLVSRIGLESVAIPVQRHLAGCHGVEHVVLEVLEGLSHLCFVHAPIISTGSRRVGSGLCH